MAAVEKADKGSLNNRTGSQADLRGEFIQGQESIAKLDSDWDELFSRAQDAPAYFSRAWIQTFINHKRFRGMPCLIVVWSGSKLVALLPFAIYSVFGIRICQMIGSRNPSYLGLLLDWDFAEAISVVADVWIREKVAHIFCNKYLSSLDKSTTELFKEFNNRGCIVRHGFARPCPWIRLDCSFEEYLQKTKSGKRRKKLRYAERQVMNDEKVAIVSYEGREITSEVHNRIATIQRESWMKRRGASVLGLPFYQDLMTTMAGAGLSTIWLMTIDGDDAAFSYTLVAHKKLDIIWMAFKLKYESSVSFGKILTMQVIRNACEERIESFDLGLGDCEWKQFWSTGNHDLERIIAGRCVIGYVVVLFYMLLWRLAKNEWMLTRYRRFKKWLRELEQQRCSSSKMHTKSSE